MRRWLTASCLLFLLAIVGCGPSGGGSGDDGDGTGRPDASDGDGDGDGGTNPGRPDAKPRIDAAAPGTIKGKVWAPNMAPGVAPAMQEIPIFGALIYVALDKPAGIPREIFCEPCVATPPGGVYSSHDGSFSLSVDPGTYWLVIQKAQFRLEQQIEVKTGETIDLQASQTTLPSRHDPAMGMWMPKMAVVMGSSDQIEDVLGKIGIGTVSASGEFTDTAMDLDVFKNGGRTGRVNPAETGNQLLASYDKMKQYHIIFFACSTSALTLSPAVRTNIRRYVKDGGKIYVTDWSGEVMDRPFPTQVQLGGFGIDSTGTYDPANPAVDNITISGSSDGSGPYTSDAETVDPDLSQWLGLQRAPTEENESVAEVIDPRALDVTHNWNFIQGLTTVTTGTDDQGEPIENAPKVWIKGTAPGRAGDFPLSVTFEPTGCGRVLYSTYQTSSTTHPSLHPQERVLLYLIMEIGACVQTVPPIDE